ncbi:peptidoglycan hydrolase RipC [Mycobacteroides abscessus]|nr:peptidoglycan hydrolase RipC [Mycobacteroides abscessus]MDB2215224.1 peptidoglycan hydrolase RipC [Mycobacteroides abscessus subsp. massiliense]MDB2307218.1 peptidoglycan hydrolase RipC [Mycobacteroides abscessus subsp. massiliense]MDM2053745.1 peptidoglycan hydrolase RipC [Mycobacteroides abscessus]MDM2058753.1 peptidoglycan hydrolase RipC [Mycobacteroides abscessus]MDM2063574.1 peptidoglycan hydrolase RipC [Mycobacteroides abscessus]
MTPSPLRRTMLVVTAAALVGGVFTGAQTATADPNNDAVKKLNELSRQAEATSEAANTAKIDLDAKLAAQRDAEKTVLADEAVAKAARMAVSTYQVDVNKAMVAAYMGGTTSGYGAVLTSNSPQNLIDQLSVQRTVGGEMRSRMDSYRAAQTSADEAEQRSRDAAEAARVAAEQAKNVRASLQAKQSQLQVQIAVVKSQYNTLSPGQRAQLAAPAPVPPPPAAEPGEAGDAPEPLMQAAAAAPAPEAAIGGGGSPAGAGAVAAALTRIGAPYSWGGSGPNAFDCSGLVMWAYGQQGVSLPHSSQALARGGTPVPLSELQPGDVINFYGDASHTGIYVGNGMMVHASTYGVPVAVVPITSSGPIYNARRY